LTITSDGDISRTAPSVAAVTPLNETGSALAQRIVGLTVTFDRPMNPATVTRADVRIIDPNGLPVRIVSVLPATTMNPMQFRVKTGTWIKSGDYQVRIGPAVADQFGNSLDGNGNGNQSEMVDASTTVHTLTHRAFLSTQPPAVIPRGKSLIRAIAINPAISINELAIELNIQHPSVGDLKITLIAPNGTEIVLVANRGGAGDNFVRTVFSTAAVNPIAAATAAFHGDFRADDDVGLAGLIGQNAKGYWKLKIEDTGTGDAGKLLSWGVYVRP
jgi:subtilisin-like proprotein convertase family protein